MGIYYNRALIDTVPTKWSTLANMLKKPVEDIPQTPAPEDTTLLNTSINDKAPTEQPAFSNLGYGRETPESPDIIALLTVQKK